MTMKVVLVLFLVMLTQHHAMGDYWCDVACAGQCWGDPVCVHNCMEALCPNTEQSLDTTRNTICNVGCSLGHCYKFIIPKYDNDKFGSCMTSCSENYCLGENIALEKA